MLYTECLAAMDPLIGEAVALKEALSLALRFGWPIVEFECDSLVMCKEELSEEPPACWAISALVLEIRRGLDARHDWKVAWVSRKCNLLAHGVAQWAANCNRFGFISLSCLLEHIHIYDMTSLSSFILNSLI